ncbi:MAG: hypothetical protein ACI9CD_001107 [Candidatus Deianiraeaceae bacterium]|jgi:hypothetical protein
MHTHEHHDSGEFSLASTSNIVGKGSTATSVAEMIAKDEGKKGSEAYESMS